MASTLRFSRKMRLTGGRQFEAVYRGAVRANVGPLMVHALPNGAAHPRLGLAVGRRVGGAVTRNAIKRRLREGFRLVQHDLPGAYDVVISARKHEPLPTKEYQAAIVEALRALHATWIKRQAIPKARRDPE